MNTNDLSKIYDTLLSIPGMNENVKLDLKISRKQVLLLTRIIERGLKAEEASPGGLISIASAESVKELYAIASDCLEKAGLTELSGKLHALESK